MRTPNADQSAAIQETEGAIVLTAGPGSGKTTVLADRYNGLLAKGATPEEILCVTFTKEAAEEMQRRVKQPRGHFRTFHSFGYAVLASELGERPPYQPEIRHRLLTDLTKRWRLDYKELSAYISRMRHEGISPVEALESSVGEKYAMARGYAEYEKRRLAEGWIDFDSMIVDALALLEKPDVAARHQYRYIMADEMQDCDDAQMRMLQICSRRHGNIMCVGDPGQAIYGFRGAKPENIVDFGRWFPRHKALTLGMGYRSTRTITEHVQKHYPLDIPLKKQIRAARADVGFPIEYRMYLSEQDELESAVRAANQDPVNSIILSRTNRGLAFAERYCRRNNIKFNLLGKSGFFRKPEIIRAVEKLRPYGNLSVSASMGIVMPSFERHYNVENATTADNKALENIRTLREIGRDFANTLEFVNFANKAAHSRKQKAALTLSTIHQAKGTEYKNVFITGARRDNLPHANGDLAEERRIWLVAISRPKDRTRISFTGAAGDFVRLDLDEEALEKLRQQAREGNVPDVPVQGALF